MFLSGVHPLLHGFCHLLLAFRPQRFNLMMRVVTDGVDLCGEGLAGERRIAVEEHLNPVGMLLEQRPDLLLLVSGPLKRM